MLDKYLSISFIHMLFCSGYKSSSVYISHLQPLLLCHTKVSHTKSNHWSSIIYPEWNTLSRISSASSWDAFNWIHQEFNLWPSKYKACALYPADLQSLPCRTWDHPIFPHHGLRNSIEQYWSNSCELLDTTDPQITYRDPSQDKLNFQSD